MFGSLSRPFLAAADKTIRIPLTDQWGAVVSVGYRAGIYICRDGIVSSEKYQLVP
ncbi:hypothetical protein BN903_114 [Halorubrum sp. AJ67]|nr:hypothetical protein BN903_114 [Halorubrum sp. AJ67]